VDGALRLCERTPPERSGHGAATTSAAGIWVKGCFEPGTAMRLLFAVCKAPTLFQFSFGGGLLFFVFAFQPPFFFYLGGGVFILFVFAAPPYFKRRSGG